MRTAIALVASLLLCAAFATGASPSSRSSADLYRFVQTWGVPGSGPGELARPSSIAVGGWGDRVYVADTMNDRVQVFDPVGVVVHQFSSSRPVSVTTSSTGHWYELEARLLKIVKFAQMVDVAVASWQAGVGQLGQLPPSVFDPTPDEIVASGTNGLVYGRGLCHDETQCEHASDVVTQWDAFAPGHVTGVWDFHLDAPASSYTRVTALATDRQGNFYVGKAKQGFKDCSNGFCYPSDTLEWVEKYGSKGQFVGTSAGVTDFVDQQISGLAVDPNTGTIFTNSGRGIFALSPNLNSETETGIPSEPGSKIAVDCRSNVWVLSESSGAVSRYAPPQPGNSCLRRPPTVLAPAVVLAQPRVKPSGPNHPTIVVPVACAKKCGGTLTAKATGVVPTVIGHRPFRLPRGGYAEITIPLNSRGRQLAAAAGALKVSVSAGLVSDPSRPPAAVTGIVKDPSAASLACPPPAETAGVPFMVQGTVSPANAKTGRVQVVFGRGATSGHYGYLAAQPQPTTAVGHGRYRASLTADVPGVSRIQLVSLGDDAHEASHSATCTVTVAAGASTPSPTPPPPGPSTPPPSSPPSASVPALSISDVSVKEGNSGTTTMSFAVSLSTAAGKQVQVAYASKDGTASAGSDYQPTNGTLTFNPGETSKQISVKVNGDTTVEPDETFSIELSNPVNATIADGHATGTITNDDSAAPPPPPPPPPPVAKPDLTVTALDRVSGEALSFCTVQFTIQNIGDAPAAPSVTSVHGHAGIAGNWNTNVDTPALAPGQSTQLTGTIDHACNNTSITVTADTTAVIDESNEDNNFLGKTF